MPKGDFVCPFTRRSCHNCVLYRSRHCFLDNHLSKKAYLSDPAHIKADFQVLFEALKAELDAGTQADELPRITLKVIDVENGTSTICPLEEARQWDWGDEQTIRLIDGRHLTGWDGLVKVLAHKAAKGYSEVKLYVAPRFMVLAGG